MTWLISSDLHLSDRPKDSYRFGLFPWLARMQRLYGTTATFLLGDITDQKDKHSSALVNRIIEEMIGLEPPIFILKGNHDFVDPNNPYFNFLNCIEGVRFITEPVWLEEFKVAMIPHQPDQAAFDQACEIIQPDARAVFSHATYDGALTETGTRLNGLGAALMRQKAPGAALIAGDIHKPQHCGPVTYVGSPYHVRFGDDYTPRVLLLKDGKQQNLYYPAPHKWTLTIRDEDDLLNDEYLKPGDQVKLTIEMAREEAVEWAAHKQRVLNACKELGLEVYGCDLKVNTSKTREHPKTAGAKTNQEVFSDFCQAENVASNVKKAGQGFLK